MSFITLIDEFTSSSGLIELFQNNWLLGLSLIFAIIFCETGFVILPFLPGDSLLFSTGAFLSATGHSLWWVGISTILAAVLGDMTNYITGKSRVGQYLRQRKWINPQHIEKTEQWFQRYGGATVSIARFIPIVRTIAPFLAGISKMGIKRFAMYNILGAFCWCMLLISAGYWLGKIDWVQKHFQWMTLGIIFISLVPVAIHLFSSRKPAS